MVLELIELLDTRLQFKGRWQENYYSHKDENDRKNMVFLACN